MQSSRSISTTCPREGRLLRFESNSTATSDGGAQKLGNDVRRNSELISTKVCSQIGRKWNAMFETHVVTSVDRTTSIFNLKIFLAVCLCKHLSTVLLTNHPKHDLEDLSYISSYQSSLFQGQWAALWALRKNCAKWKYWTPIYAECYKMYWSKVCVQEFSYFVSGLDIQVEKS